MTQAGALLLSLAIEVPVVGAVEGRGRPLAVAAAATLLTHPFAWNGWQALIPHLPWLGRALLVELSVVAVEAALYAWLLRLPAARAVALSLCANALSFGLGLLVIRLGRAAGAW